MNKRNVFVVSYQHDQITLMNGNERVNTSNADVNKKLREEFENRLAELGASGIKLFDNRHIVGTNEVGVQVILCDDEDVFRDICRYQASQEQHVEKKLIKRNKKES